MISIERNDSMNKFLFFTVMHIAAAWALYHPAALFAQPVGAPAQSPAENKSNHTQNAAPGIGYATPQAALDALRKRKDVNSRIQEKWLIVRDDANKTVWSFTPVDHPAYPAVIKRSLVNTDGREQIETSALCQAKRAACDKVVAEFRAADEKMRDTFQKTSLTPAPTPKAPNPPDAPNVVPMPAPASGVVVIPTGKK